METKTRAALEDKSDMTLDAHIDLNTKIKALRDAVRRPLALGMLCDTRRARVCARINNAHSSPTITTCAPSLHLVFIIAGEMALKTFDRLHSIRWRPFKSLSSPAHRKRNLAAEGAAMKPCEPSRLHRVRRSMRAIEFVAGLTLGCAVAAPGYADDRAAPDAAPAADAPAPATAAPVVDPHAAQNPIANVISIPFQNNTYFDAGPLRRAENVLLVQPVVPFSVDKDWTVVTRWVTPIISTPRVSETIGSKTGLGNIEPQFYFTPTHPGPIIWGVGPEAYLPTATDKTFGVNKWGGGVAAVALTIQGHWLFGALVNNVWAGGGKEKVNELTLQPFVFYNLPKGWYLVSSTVTTANWEATSRNQWTVPVGGGFGRVFKIGKQAINARVEVTDNVQRPIGGPTWASQFQVQLLY